VVQKVHNYGGVVAQYDAFTNLTTTSDGYVDAGVVICTYMKTKRFAFTAVTNTLTLQVLGSIDGGVTYPFTVESAFDVTVAASPVVKSYTDYYTHLKVQVKPKVAGVHGTLQTKWAGASF